MNHTYRLVWNHIQNRLVVAAETTSGRGKNGSRATTTTTTTATTTTTTTLRAALLGGLALAASAPALAAPPAANQLPVGGQVVAGSASISQQAARMDIHQQSNKAIINWQGFDIGSQAQVNFAQPSSSSVALNRVLSSNPSQIQGQLNANGQVYLVNPNGVVFAQGSQVNVGGLVASTLDITNQDFLDGKTSFSRGNASGGIQNQGSLTAHDGGSIALIAPKVVNEGIVSAQMGNVVLASGNKVTLSDGANGLIQVAVEPSTVDSLIENKALIKADGGQVIMTASAAGTLQGGIVNNSGTVQAQSLQNKDGRILLLGDMQHGQTQAAGELSAKFVETSAAKVVLDKDLKVDTQGGEWLIDPVDITIDSAKASAIQTGLSSGNVTVTTADSATNLWGNNGTGMDAGDIHVNAAISWNQNTLTLTADNDININAVMAASGSSTLVMNTGSAGKINVAHTDTGFTGRVDFPGRSGTGFLTINGQGYTVINSLGAENSTTGTDLQGMSGNLSGYYALGSNIDASATSSWNSGAGFAPIGNSSNQFTGSFDGLGHSISGLTINRPGTDYVGLFGYTNGASIRNIGLDGLNVKGQNYVGGLVGINQSSSSISNSTASGNVEGVWAVGGLVGFNYVGSIISNSTASGNVIGTSDYVGGLAGSNQYSSSISNSTASGDVEGTGNYVGGLVGDNYNNSSIDNSTASGNVTGTGHYVGGLAGYNNSSISNSYASGSVTGTGDRVGGLVGYNDSSSISSSFWDTQTTGRANGCGEGDCTGATGKTTTEMKSLATFQGAGWDIDDKDDTATIWRIHDGASYPLLRGLPLVEPPVPPVEPPVPPVEPPAPPVEQPSAGDIYRDTAQTSGNPADMGPSHDPRGLLANYTPSLQPVGEHNGFPGMGSALVTLAPGYVPFAPGVEETAIAVGDPSAATAEEAVAGDEEKAKRRRGHR